MLVDARGRSCPEPIIMTKKALSENDNKATVIVDSAMAMENVKRFVENKDLKVSVTEKDGEYTLEIK